MTGRKIPQFQRSESSVTEKAMRTKMSFSTARKPTIDTVTSLDKFENDSVGSMGMNEDVRRNYRNGHIGKFYTKNNFRF